jgi:hypothetical protein
VRSSTVVSAPALWPARDLDLPVEAPESTVGQLVGVSSYGSKVISNKKVYSEIDKIYSAT